MKSFVLGLTALFYLSLTALDPARADDSSTMRNEAKLVKPSAPRVSCAITMQHWCIIGGDGIVNMLDDGNNRTWTITSSMSGRPGVIVRESKLCDSPADFHPEKISETDYMKSREARHAVTFSLTKGDACTVRVEYPLGTDDRAREAQRIAKYWLYACADASCNIPLLNIPASQPAHLSARAWSASDLTRPLGKEEAPQLLEDWSWLVGADHKPIMITAMGDAFVLNEKSGAISFLDTVEGKLQAIASSLDAFYKRLDKDQGFVNEYFSTRLLGEARADGLSLGAHQVYSFKHPPVLGGTQTADNLEPSDLAVHFSMLGQIFQQVHNLPPGTKIKKIELR